MSAARQCEACGAPLAGDQRYCLLCGTRVGARGELLGAVLARVRAPGAAGRADHAGGAPTQPDASPRTQSPRSQPRLPGPWLSALLVLVFLAFGALLGGAGAGAGRLSAAAPALKLVVAHPATAVQGPSAEAGETSAAPPASEAESTPAPAPAEASQGAEAASGQPESSASAEGGAGNSGANGAASGKRRNSAKSHATTAKLGDIEHVFEIVLSDEPYAADFGPESKASYLARTLESKGELLLRYDAVAHEQLPNAVALLSGQGPTAQTAADCPSYTQLSPATAAPDEQVLGDGCVYPASVQTLPGQLTAKHLSWRAYVQGIDEGAGTQAACAHPALGAADPSFAAGDLPTYRNPFVYFASIAASASCTSDDVGLSELSRDLSGAAASVPAFSYIVPDRCDDAGPLACSPGAPSGPADADGLLSRLVPEIMASKAFQRGGLIVITSDEAPSSGEFADSSSCCGQPSYPNLTPGLRDGGGAVGALLLSPFVKGGTTATEPYNHYSLLRTVEDIFGLAHLGYAALPSVKPFSATLLNEPAGKR